MRCDHSFTHGASHATQKSSLLCRSTSPHFAVNDDGIRIELGPSWPRDVQRSSRRCIQVKRITGDWQMEIKSKPAFDIAIQTITFQPGGQSGWHSHHGTWQLSFGYVLHVVCRICIYQQISRVDSRFRRPCGYNHTDSLLARFDAMHGAVKLDTTGCYTP